LCPETTIPDNENFIALVALLLLFYRKAFARKKLSRYVNDLKGKQSKFKLFGVKHSLYL